jgi:TetR/AcrR family transcriptional regulator, repressor for uid operon
MPELPDQREPLAERLLDAAAHVVARHGLRRTTMDDIARAAGCSRQTLYKHHPTREHLFARMFVREVERYVEALEALVAADGPPAPGRVADAFVFTLRHVRAHPVVRGVAEADEQGLLAVMALEDGAVLAVITHGVTRALSRFVTTGVVRPVDPAHLGEAFVRLVASFLVLPPLGEERDDEALRAFARRFLI